MATLIKGIIFDFGGVLTSYTGKTLIQGVSEILSLDYDAICPVFKKNLPELEKGEEIGFYKKVNSELKTNFSIEKWNKLLHDEYVNDMKLDDEMLLLIKKLRHAGYRLAVLSNTIKPHVLVNRNRKNFRYFDAVILSSEVGLRKPEPQIYKKAIDALSLKAEECVFTDDMKVNVLPANKLGIHTILYRNPKRLEMDLRQFGVIF